MTEPLIKIESVTVEIVYMDGSRETMVLNAERGPLTGEARVSQEFGRVDIARFGDVGAMDLEPQRWALSAEFSAGTAIIQRVAADGSTWTGPQDAAGRRATYEALARLRDQRDANG